MIECNRVFRMYKPVRQTLIHRTEQEDKTVKRTRTAVRRILCFLLCLSMLPLVKVSAAGYNDAYQTIINWAKQGEYGEGQEEDIGNYRGWGQIIEKNDNEGFAVVFQDAVDPGKQDRIILAYLSAYSDYSARMTSIVLTSTSDKVVEVVMESQSAKSDGSADSHGNYDGLMVGTMLTDRTLEEGFDVMYCDAAASQNKVRTDCIKELKKVLEYTDKILRENSELSIQDIFKKMNAKSLHNFSRSWVAQAETCTEDGSMGYQCSVCGAQMYEPIKAHHNWEIAKVYSEPTAEHGFGEYVCTRCFERKEDEICISRAFTDMPAKDNWAHAGIDWAVFNNITNGTSATTFSPGQGCTRAQVVTFLWRAAGCPEPVNTDPGFRDVKSGAYYEKAVAWALENEITKGMTMDLFAPDSTCTRGQIVTFLWRFKGRPAAGNANTPFVDLKAGGFYLDAVAWAVENGITNGTSKTEFSPDSPCTRAQVVTFLYRTPQPSAEPIELIDWVGIFMPTDELTRWKRDGFKVKEQLLTRGYNAALFFASNSAETQKSQIEEIIAKGYKIIIVAPIDGEDLAPTLKKARKAGIKVIDFDRPIMDAGAIDYLATSDNFDIGAAQGDFIVDQLDLENAGDKTYNIELVGGAPDDINAHVFYDGAMSVLRPYIDAGTLNVVSGQIAFEDVAAAGWSSENARTRFEQLLKQYYSDKPLHAVLASNDSTAQGVASALEGVYSNDVYPILTGQDCDIVSVHNMLDGKQAMSVIKDTQMLAAYAAAIAIDIMRGVEPKLQDSFFNGETTIEVPTITCPPKVCTTDTIEEYLIEPGYYTQEEVYGSER